MREVYDLRNEHLTERQQEAVEAVGLLAVQQVEQQYGSGYPHFAGGHQGGLAYHNLHHTQYVMQGSERMVSEMGLGRTAYLVAKAAAAAHDIVQLKPRGVMEQESAAWLEDMLRLQSVPPNAIRAGALAILGTEPIIEGVRVVGQRVNSLSFPDRTTELVARSVAAADLAELYDPFGPYHGHRLWQEIKGRAPHEDFPMEGMIGFQENQVALVHDYRFPHPTAEKLFGRLKGAVVSHQEQILRELVRGTISSGDELLAADLAFAARQI